MTTTTIKTIYEVSHWESIVTWNSQKQPCRVSSIIISILQKGKLRLREVKQLVHDDTARMRQARICSLHYPPTAAVPSRFLDRGEEHRRMCLKKLQKSVSRNAQHHG